MKKNIAIIMGGYSSEYGISIKSGNVVYQHLSKDRFNAYRVVITKDRWYMLDESDGQHEVNKHDFSVDTGQKIIRFDCVFNAIHGSPGEDGIMQAYFELIAMPQTSCGYYQAALTFNKRDLLSALHAYGIKSAASFYLNNGDPIDEDAIVNTVGLPCFVKPNKSGSSFGMTKVHKKEGLAEAIRSAFKEDNEIIIESFLDGTEVSVGVIRYKGQTRVLPVTEIVSENDFFDYEAKYEGKSQEITPARISSVQEKNVKSVVKKAYELLQMSGFSRSEFIFIGDEPMMLEMNSNPGLTEESILPQQAVHDGISLPELFESAIDDTLAQNQ